MFARDIALTMVLLTVGLMGAFTPSRAADASLYAASSASAAAPYCTGRQLSVRGRQLGAAASHDGVQVVFTNRGTRTCVLYGYPGAAALNRYGKQFRQAERTRNGYLAGRDTGRPRNVVLRPGKRASSIVEGTSIGGRRCAAGRGLLVTAPNTSRSVRIGYPRGYYCNLEVHRVIAGVQH